MTELQTIKMDYDLSIGNAERRLAQVQETLDNLSELIIPLRDEIDIAGVGKRHWIGGVDAVRNIADILSHELDELQNDITLSKVAVKKLTEVGDADAGKEV